MNNTSVRFVHTADLHLDSPLKSLALRDPELATLVGSATHTALQRIVDLCIAEQVDALLLAGDLYDGSLKSMHTAAKLTTQMHRLHKADIPVLMIRGNHDSQSSITGELALPENVHVFDGKGGHRRIADGKAVVHGVSFSKPHAPDSLLPKYRAPHPDTINIGMLHTSLSGADGHDNYAPCSINELHALAYDYWALGHIHKRAEYHGDSTVVMPGIPQGRDIGEAGARSVSLVSIDEQHQVTIIEHTVGPVQFDMIELDLQAITDRISLDSAIDAALHSARDATDIDQLIVRIRLTGESTIGFMIHRDVDLILQTARESAALIGNIWVETLRIRLASDTAAARTTPDSSDDIETLKSLAEIIHNEVLISDELHEAGQAELKALLSALPPQLRDVFGDSLEQQQTTLQRLTKEGCDSLLTQLASL